MKARTRNEAWKESKKPRKAVEPEPPFEHPDDKASRLEAEAESAQFGDSLASTRLDDLKRLLTVYADGDAEEALANLREWFWATALPEAVARAKESK